VLERAGEGASNGSEADDAEPESADAPEPAMDPDDFDNA
jgi:hypothetical protein